MSKRIKTFTVDAESVQGIAGAKITFKRLKRSEWRAWRDDDTMTDDDLVASHIVDWSGILDDDDNELPSPKDEPGVLGELYFTEIPKIASLLLQGPDGASALKN